MKARFRVLTVASCLVVLGCGSSQRSEDTAVMPLDMVDLLKASPAATVKSSRPESVRSMSMSVNQQSRPVLFMHPDSQAEFPPVRITSDAWLEFGIGINEAAWDQAGDGVQFTILVKQADGKQRQVFAKYIDPKSNPTERCWLNFEIPLKAFAGQEVRLLFTTTSGPAKNSNCDWAGWSTPRLFLPKGS